MMTDYTNPDALVGVAWLAGHFNDAMVRILDASWHLPPTGRNAGAEYDAAHIPGARFYDLDALSDRSTPLPHMLPTPAAFGRDVGALGIGDDDHVVVYDADGLFSAPRVWWTFRVFGHDRVSVLAGGFKAWRAAGQPVTAERPEVRPKSFKASFRPDMVRSLDQMRANLDSRAEQVLDARARSRFTGAEPEFRPGVRSGHIPGSTSLPYQHLVDPATGTFLPADRLRAVFDAAGVDPRLPVTTTCGSGVTACILGFGLHLTGRDDWAVYDGSWTEWGGRPDTPVET
jgi:thiosulfate/3-mercaptopyruvate sulfurtransferase